MSSPTRRQQTRDANDELFMPSSTISDIPSSLFDFPDRQNTPRQLDFQYTNGQTQPNQSSVLSDPPASDLILDDEVDAPDVDMEGANTFGFEDEDDGEPDGWEEQAEEIEQLGDVLLDGVRRPYRERRTTSWKRQYVIKTLQEDCHWNLK